MKIRPNRQTERAAVNATRTLFESCNHIFQEVDLGNDFGKDVYVDVTDGTTVTGLCIALQIKGGASYRRPGGYGIPLDDAHATFWMHSSLPIAGVVFDPDDGHLRWCSISAFLHERSSPLPSYIPVDGNNLLTRETLESDFKPAFSAFHTQRVIGSALLSLASEDRSVQIRALQDCFILGRSDARVLITIRRLLQWLPEESLRLAVKILAHATPHPDIFFHAKNIIPEKTCDLVRPHLQWSQEEISLLMHSAEWPEWHRGGQGQNVYSLLCVDPSIEQKMADCAITSLRKNDDELAFNAMYLAVYWARREGRQMYDGFVAIDNRFAHLPFSAELRAVIEQQDSVTLFE